MQRRTLTSRAGTAARGWERGRASNRGRWRIGWRWRSASPNTQRSSAARLLARLPARSAVHGVLARSPVPSARPARVHARRAGPGLGEEPALSLTNDSARPVESEVGFSEAALSATDDMLTAEAVC